MSFLEYQYSVCLKMVLAGTFVKRYWALNDPHDFPKKFLKKQLLQCHNVILLFIYWYLVFFNLNFWVFHYIETNWEPTHLVCWSNNSLKRPFRVFMELIDKNLLRKTDECCSCTMIWIYKCTLCVVKFYSVNFRVLEPFSKYFYRKTYMHHMRQERYKLQRVSFWGSVSFN